MYPLSLVLAVIVPALVLVTYGLIKTRRTLLREALWAGFVGGIAVGVAVIAWELAQIFGVTRLARNLVGNLWSDIN